ncbi:MAG: AAA family ATPase [Simkaniaceae bacterium]|nr:AAA family ATPase [Candidatus Sacchlamyda saccharinae]
MGLAKQKLFGEKKQLPLQTCIDKGIFLPIDVAYAQLIDPENIPLQAALLKAAREGHLCFEKSLIEDPALLSLLPDGRHYLPKYQQIEETIVSHVKRLTNLSIITGGPGTGKTYTATQIIQEAKTKTIVAAPTGKAAAHLLSKIDLPIKGGTLHSLLTDEPLDAELIIVDECSMIDPILFARLLSSTPTDATLILMGDVHQLPAVEGGSVFKDLIDSGKIPTTTLTKCHRSDQKEILDLATAILNNTTSDIRNIHLGFSQNNIEKIYQNLWSHVKDKDFSTFRILSTLRKGPLGTDALNRFLYEKFSPAENYPILITRNDKKTGLSNGETGLLSNNIATFGDLQIPKSQLPPFEYAYCISVHKSQGSEYDDVLLLVPDGSESFGKEVLYTAVTRAKHTLHIDGSLAPIISALTSSTTRLSGISSKL